MKKEIINLINSEEGIFRINNCSFLTRWTKNASGKNVDQLRLHFDRINGVEFSFTREIHSRDFAGIEEEIEAATEEFFLTVSQELRTNLRAGYRNCH